MKFRCVCGNVIRDGTDNLPYKTRCTADQDVIDLLWMTTEQKDNAFGEYYRTMYQCPQCGGLFLEQQNSLQMLIFKPEGHDRTRVLGSMRGREYKIGLRGTWFKRDEPFGILEWDDVGDLLGARNASTNGKICGGVTSK